VVTTAGAPGRASWAPCPATSPQRSVSVPSQTRASPSSPWTFKPHSSIRSRLETRDP
jgi:hypothetical protein